MVLKLIRTMREETSKLITKVNSLELTRIATWTVALTVVCTEPKHRQ